MATDCGIAINQIIEGDCLEVMRTWPDNCVHCVVTSPPYWGLRDYGIEPSVWGGAAACEHEWAEHIQPAADGTMTPEGNSALRAGHQGDHSATLKPKRSAFCRICGAWKGCYGLEPTPDLFVGHTVLIFREVRRVLRDDGTLWLNLGDSYCGSWGNSGNRPELDGKSDGQREKTTKYLERGGWDSRRDVPPNQNIHGLKHKDLVGIPWRVAFALQADGWYLRQDIIWHKPNPMPESVNDRCTKAHEYIFLLTKSARYYYDAEAVKEDCESGPSDIRKMQESLERIGGKHKVLDDPLSKASMHTNIGRKRSVGDPSGRNKRSVWSVATSPFKGAHFATFPPELVRPCILAGTSQKGCCPNCGAPWERVVKKSGGTTGKSWHDHAADMVAGMSQTVASGGLGVKEAKENGMYSVQTLGWRPGCKCEGTNGELAPVPCVVLDPFGGSGTTGMVAAQEGRNYVMIERNAKYVQMARETRLAPVDTAVPLQEAKAGQRGLFESAPSVSSVPSVSLW